MFFVYVLKDKHHNDLYTGFTNDLLRRFDEHKSGQVQSTKRYQNLQVIYYEVCIDRRDAFAREKFLKSGAGKLFLKKRLKYFLKEVD